ncbi:MAG: MFS transporter [Haloarculaceae archaeon]
MTPSHRPSPAIGEQFVLTDAEIGWVMASFSFSTFATIPVTGVIADIYGRRTVALFIFGASGIGALFVGSFEGLLLMRVLQGAAYAGTTPLSVALIGDLYSGTEGSTAQGVRASANGAANIVAPIIGGLLAGLMWSFPFLIYGLAFPVMVLLYVFYSEPIDNSTSRLTDPLRVRLVRYLQNIAGDFRNRDLSVLVGAGFVLFVVRYAVLTYLPLFATRELGTTVFMVGVLLSIRGVVRVVISPFAGVIVGRLSRKPTLVWSFFIIGVSTAAMAFAPSVVWLGGLLAVYGGAIAIFNTVLNDTVTNIATADRRAGVVSSMSTLKNFGKAVSPVIFGIVLAATGFTVLFVLAAVLAVGYVALISVTYDGT